MESLDKYTLMKGQKSIKITNISDGGKVKTRYGPRTKLIFNNDDGVAVHVLINPAKQELHPKSNLYQIMSRYNAENLMQLVGKLVEVRLDKNGFWRIVY